MMLPIKAAKVLIVEDEGIVALDLQQQLISFGYDVVGRASEGQQAIDLVKEKRPDVVLMDVQLMGEMDGIAAARVIGIDLHTPVVFATSFDAREVIERAKLSQPYGFILKPFAARELPIIIDMAIYKHQTETKLRHSMEQLQTLSRRVLEVQESERRRIAIELHDELGQSLTAIKINLQSAELFKDQNPAELNAENIRIVEDAIQQIRRISLALRPSMLDDLGLVPAIRWLAEQTAVRAGFVVHFDIDRQLERLLPEIETACFRIVQEALTNIVKYANATEVVISVRHDGAVLHLSVVDNGQGFDTAAMLEFARQGKSIGILGMQERAMLIGGQIQIDSEIGQGCRITLQSPLTLVLPK
jgi:signal transduction histidine kinase